MMKAPMRMTSNFPMPALRLYLRRNHIMDRPPNLPCYVCKMDEECAAQPWSDSVPENYWLVSYWIFWLS